MLPCQSTCMIAAAAAVMSALLFASKAPATLLHSTLAGWPQAYGAQGHRVHSADGLEGVLKECQATQVCCTPRRDTAALPCMLLAAISQ